jgi:glycosyltransferase involved in cell wall biosynthesis
MAPIAAMTVPTRESSRRLRVACLQKAPSGHMNACLQRLIDDGVDVFATVPPPLADAPYEERAPIGLSDLMEIPDLGRTEELLPAVRRFGPDVLLVVGWDVAAYRRCARALRGEAVRVLCTDAQWLRTARQRVGVAIAPWYLAPCFDRMFFPCERQRQFAKRLGFGDAVDLGFYSADVDAFAMQSGDSSSARAFLFVGRLVPEKCVDLLVEAYRSYRRLVSDPFDLVVAGTGPLARALEAENGVEALGFVPPRALPAVYARASALVLPSRFEPWGVVVHEATCQGLAVITTRHVGAADDLVVHGRNGFLTNEVTADDICAGMLWWHERDDDDRRRAARLSVELSGRFSPERWSRSVSSMARART